MREWAENINNKPNLQKLIESDLKKLQQMAFLAIFNDNNNKPLFGLPFTLKDSIDTKDIISTWGTEGRTNFIPQQNATVAERLINAGGILLGKTNTTEFTMGR